MVTPKLACLSGDTNQLDSFRQTLARFSHFSNDAAWPYGAGGANGYFALIADHYMRQFGITRDTFGKIAVAQRQRVGLSSCTDEDRPHCRAIFRCQMIASPPGLFDCVMPCAGANFLVMHAKTANRLSLPAVRPLLLSNVITVCRGSSPVSRWLGA